MNKRIFHGYLLDEHSNNDKYPCDLCELEDLCDETSDTMNHIEYTLCNEVDSEYKKQHPYAYFKKI